MLNTQVNSAAIFSCAYHSVMTRRDVLIELINQKFGGNRAECARAIKRSPSQVHQWVSGHRNLGEAGARHIEMTLGLPQGYFDHKDRRLPSSGQHANVGPGPDTRGFVPLISWVQAGEWREAVDHLQPGDAEEWLPCPKPHSPHAFALRVRGNSMQSPYPGQKTYPEGTIIYVDPDMSPTPGKRVVAKIRDTGEVTFKEYSEDAGRKFLRPLNPQYPVIEIDEKVEIIGVVIGSYMNE